MAKGGARKGPGKGPAARKTSAADFQAALQALLALAEPAEEGSAEEALEIAQDKAFDAMEAPTRRERIAMAKEALAISPLCADGHAILAREAETPEESLAHYRQAVEAGAQALGAAVFEEDVGHFWGLIETRPYMRARHELALLLWEIGEREEAISHYRDMLRLNPDDNQGIRYLLLNALLTLGRDGEAAGLLAKYRDDASAAWTWSAALLAFRQKGDSAASRRALASAVDSNPHLPAYLLGRKKLPRELPDYVGFGDEDEAIAYVHDSRDVWAAAPDAKEWVESALSTGSSGASEDAGAGADAEEDRIDDAVLALLLLGRHDGDRAWKGFDWQAMNRLHEKGYISDPVGKAKSVRFTEKGLERAEALYRSVFIEGAPVGDRPRSK